MFVCIENNQVTSVVDYEPNVPDTVHVVRITQADYEKIQGGTHYFDAVSASVKKVPQKELNKELLRQKNAAHQEFLASTDWMVLRHIREKALGLPTSLNEDKYSDLERQRQQAADSIQR